MRFRAEFDMEVSDCSWCPCFENDEDSGGGICRLSEIRGEPEHMDSILTSDRKIRYPIPIDCPLEVVFCE